MVEQLKSTMQRENNLFIKCMHEVAEVTLTPIQLARFMLHNKPAMDMLSFCKSIACETFGPDVGEITPVDRQRTHLGALSDATDAPHGAAQGGLQGGGAQGALGRAPDTAAQHSGHGQQSHGQQMMLQGQQSMLQGQHSQGQQGQQSQGQHSQGQQSHGQQMLQGQHSQGQQGQNMLAQGQLNQGQNHGQSSQGHQGQGGPYPHSMHGSSTGQQAQQGLHSAQQQLIFADRPAWTAAAPYSAPYSSAATGGAVDAGAAASPFLEHNPAASLSRGTPPITSGACPRSRGYHAHNPVVTTEMEERGMDVMSSHTHAAGGHRRGTTGESPTGDSRFCW